MHRHVWLLFEEALSAGLARKVGSCILTETMERRPDIGFDGAPSDSELLKVFHLAAFCFVKRGGHAFPSTP
jgi:hypothetical protein